MTTLDDLEKMLAAHALPWTTHNGYVETTQLANNGDHYGKNVWTVRDCDLADEDSVVPEGQLMVAAVNVLPKLISRIRALEAVAEAARGWRRAFESRHPHYAFGPDVSLAAALDALDGGGL